MLTLAESPSELAMICVVPASFAMTFAVFASFVEMFTMVGSATDQTMLRYFNGWPEESLNTASMWVDCPMLSVASMRESLIDATGAGWEGDTLSDAAPDFAPFVAVMVAEPAPVAVTAPEAETEATELLSDAHCTG